MITSANNHEFKIDCVTVRYGATTALDGVSLNISPGECVAVVGPSGAGKTTLLRVMNCTVRPTSGRAIVHGHVISTLSAGQLRRLRAKVGFIHQDLSLVPNLRVIQNVLSGKFGHQSLAGALRAMIFPARRECMSAHNLLERVGVQEKLYERTDRLSGGQQQRVAIARALYQDPVTLLADEPVSSVDPARARATVSLLTQICREQGLTLCMSLHRLELAREFFPRLVGMRAGRIVFDRRAEQLGDNEFRSLYRLGTNNMIEDER